MYEKILIQLERELGAIKNIKKTREIFSKIITSRPTLETFVMLLNIKPQTEPKILIC